jgi:hypothetical protein
MSERNDSNKALFESKSRVSLINGTKTCGLSTEKKNLARAEDAADESSSKAVDTIRFEGTRFRVVIESGAARRERRESIFTSGKDKLLKS